MYCYGARGVASGNKKPHRFRWGCDIFAYSVWPSTAKWKLEFKQGAYRRLHPADLFKLSGLAHLSILSSSAIGP